MLYKSSDGACLDYICQDTKSKVTLQYNTSLEHTVNDKYETVLQFMHLQHNKL